MIPSSSIERYSTAMALYAQKLASAWRLSSGTCGSFPIASVRGNQMLKFVTQKILGASIRQWPPRALRQHAGLRHRAVAAITRTGSTPLSGPDGQTAARFARRCGRRSAGPLLCRALAQAPGACLRRLPASLTAGASRPSEAG